MNIKEAVTLLQTKITTDEEKYALALLVCELDTQFCLGWGAGCMASEEALFEAFRTARADGEGLPLGNLHEDVFQRVAAFPEIEAFRFQDFPPMEVFREMRAVGSALYEQDDDLPF